jgi:hypothetical protein
MRKELSEGEKPEEGPQEGEREPKEPRDPNERSETEPEDEGEPGAAQQNALPAWAVSLPPQVRDALIRGDFEMVPAEYRELVRRYHRWLLEQEEAGSRGR